MLQRRWLELVKDYNCVINYHPGKADVVADTLSSKSSSIAHLNVQGQILRDLQNMQIDIVPKGTDIRFSTIMVRPTLAERIKVDQTSDDELQKLRQRDVERGNMNFESNIHDIWMYQDRMYVPRQGNLRQDILVDAHATPYSIHPEGTKMYKDLKPLFRWPGMSNVSTSKDRTSTTDRTLETIGHSGMKMRTYYDGFHS